MLSVYHDNQFEKLLENLKRSGGNGALVAKRAEALIEELTLSEGYGAAESCRLTKNGEARIRNCRKYDLRNGYRLVCIRKGRHLILLYVGTHDDCDRWLEHNRGLRPVLEPELPTAAPLAARPKAPPAPPVTDLEPDAADFGSKEQFTVKELRLLFSGLCGR